MSFISSISYLPPFNPSDLVTLLRNQTTYYQGNPYTFTLTDFDSFTTYTVSTNNGTISITGDTITWTPATAGAATITVSGRNIPLTVSNPLTATYLLISGGSRGNDGWPGGGGGGGGGRKTGTSTNVIPGTTYTVTVGGGSGNSSVFGDTITPGGSGNGGTAVQGDPGVVVTTAGASGRTGEGNSGGSGRNGGVEYDPSGWPGYYFPSAGGGGGGAGAVGNNGTAGAAGSGGNGTSITFGGLTATFCGGGGGGFSNLDVSPSSAAGGTGGGGTGRGWLTGGSAGSANTGGGGGGGALTQVNGYSGGSGIVIIRAPQAAVAITGTYTTSTDGAFTVYRFTSSGTIRF